MGNFLDFLNFWGACLIEGIHVSHGLFAIVEGACVIIGAGLYWESHIRSLKEYREKWHYWEVRIKKGAFLLFVSSFVVSTFLAAPFIHHREAEENLVKQKRDNADLHRQLTDRSPKLNGYLRRCFAADEPGASNSLIFVETTVDNRGGMASYAYGFSLKVKLSETLSTNADDIDFAGEYKMNLFCDGKPYLLDLKRSELISEKTAKAIEPGYPARGWAAFRLKGIPIGRYSLTNIILSFFDINRNLIDATNDGGVQTLPCAEALAKATPGSENIFSAIEVVAPTNREWLPPELPSGCSNVTVFFGAHGLVEPRQIAEISDAGTRFAIKDLPDSFLQNSDGMPGYSPRQQYIWIKSGGAGFSIGGKTVRFPIHPVVVSNRLYIEVEIPFSNEKHKLVMSDAFDADLSPLPLSWDRNYSTNYSPDGGIYAYEIVNELTNPILQVVYSAPNEVHVNGIFQVESNSILAAFGEQPILGTFTWTNYDLTTGVATASLEIEKFHEALMVRSNETLASFGRRFTNEFFRPIFKFQRPIFKYPSNRHLGAFAEAAVPKQ